MEELPKALKQQERGHKQQCARAEYDNIRLAGKEERERDNQQTTRRTPTTHSRYTRPEQRAENGNARHTKHNRDVD
ncbi:MAG: hypothetical protein QOI13_2696 [Paraburkholderia sp.]|nr:hypothetical protein [Paraburkholderia sp.]